MNPRLQACGLLLLLSIHWSGKIIAQNPRVMTWVPPYAIEASQQRLEETYEGLGPRHGISHLGLQFWTPTKQGGLQYVTRYTPIHDAKVAEFRKWGKRHGVKILLCVYNGEFGFDWELASKAFDQHRSSFVETLVQETLRLELDGIDIDFEGKGQQEASKAAFLQFLAELSEKLHQHQKELTVDTFAYKWNAPNQSWWQQILPLVDGLHVMGYDQTGAEAEGWRSYDFMKAAAGKHAPKLLFGMPSHKNEWQNQGLQKHLQWFQQEGSIGLAIWDAQFKNQAWRTKKTWKTIQQLQKHKMP